MCGSSVDAVHISKNHFLKSLADEMAKLCVYAMELPKGCKIYMPWNMIYLFIVAINHLLAMLSERYEKTSDPFLSISKIELRTENKKVIRLGMSAFIDSN